MTVAEVCLPFLSFKSGLDLVLAIFNAFVGKSFRHSHTLFADDNYTAHRDAVVKCRLIHRDVSSGNILNHFRIVSDEERTAIVAFGVLTDWELAKRIRKDGETESQEQSERMVSLRVLFRKRNWLTAESDREPGSSCPSHASCRRTR